MSLYKSINGVAVITMDHPPVNCFSHVLRTHIWEALSTAREDPGIVGVVLTGQGRIFSAGADITELGTPRAVTAPLLNDVIQSIEDFVKPVVAAISGTAVGGGLEISMACHGRVVSKDTKVGLPEIKLGFIPGAGGTQRLPRLVGPTLALEMILSGRLYPASDFEGTGLFDCIIDGTTTETAISLATDLAKDINELPRTGNIVLSRNDINQAVAAVREQLDPQQKVHKVYNTVFSAVAYSCFPVKKGITYERILFRDLVMSPESIALRQQFKTDRLAKKS